MIQVSSKRNARACSPSPPRTSVVVKKNDVNGRWLIGNGMYCHLAIYHLRTNSPQLATGDRTPNCGSNSIAIGGSRTDKMMRSYFCTDFSTKFGNRGSFRYAFIYLLSSAYRTSNRYRNKSNRFAKCFCKTCFVNKTYILRWFIAYLQWQCF